MKITGLKVFVANASRTNFVFVKLYTDDGIDGVGEATLEWKTLTVVAALEELERALVGTRPVRGRRHRRAAAPRQLLADRCGVPHGAGRGRGGAARHQGQGAGRAGVRAPGRASTATGSPATPTTGSSARATPDEYAERARGGGGDGVSGAEVGPVRRRRPGDGPARSGGGRSRSSRRCATRSGRTST